MADIPQELKDQIEKAYDYRGHVTLSFKDGRSFEGFVYNREWANPALPRDFYIDVMHKDSDKNERYSISELSSIAISGADFAAGNSYEDYLKKKAAAAKA